MRRRSRLLLVRPLVAVVALAFGLAAPAPATPVGGPMDRIAELFTRGRAVNVQLAFDSDHADHDWCMNTTVARIVDERDERGERAIAITTAEWSVNGMAHTFTAHVREGKLAGFELSTSVDGVWKTAPAGAFRFDVTEQVLPSFDEQGEAVLAAWGLCNEGRGSTKRSRATVVLRSFGVADAGDLSY